MVVAGPLKLVTLDVTNTILQFRVPPWKYYATVAKKYGYLGEGDELEKPLYANMKQMGKQHYNFGRCSIEYIEWWKNVVRLTLYPKFPDLCSVEYTATELIHDFATEKCWVLSKGANSLLCSLLSHKLCVGVISNYDPRLVDILKEMRIYNCFHFILPSYFAGCMKPDKKIFEMAQASGERYLQCPLKPSECLHIGDDLEKDYWGAKNAGWHALLLKTKSTPCGLVPPSPEHVMDSLDDIGLAFDHKKITTSD